MPPTSLKSYVRVLVLLALVGLFGGLIVGLIGSFLQLYQAVAGMPILGSLLVGLLVVLLLVFVGASVYYLFLFRGRDPQPSVPLPRPALPKTAAEKASLARENLTQLEAQAQRIQDEVARRLIEEQSAQVAKALEQPSLKVVVFGTGSAGKTSLVNALLGQNVGEVGVNLGTTLETALYRWPLPGIPEAVEIVDSPGISEMGAAGIQRELEARAQAEAADLILLVTDGDLRQSDYGPLMGLAQLGKRALLVLNKIDRYTPAEVEMLLARLRERVAGTIRYEDVLAVAANPDPVPYQGKMVKPSMQVGSLRDRVQAILYAEGPSLALDNALLQSQQLGSETRRIIAAQLRQQAEGVVDRIQWIVTAVVFANPIPAVDLLAIAAINAQMVVEIGGVYGCQMNLKQGRELAYSLAKTLASLGLVEGAIQITTGVLTAMAEVTVVGFLVTAPIQAASAGYLTRIAGKSFIEYFERNQSWGEAGIQGVVAQQAERVKGSGWLQRYVREAGMKIFGPRI